MERSKNIILNEIPHPDNYRGVRNDNWVTKISLIF